jgi:hypothetical protein
MTIEKQVRRQTENDEATVQNLKPLVDEAERAAKAITEACENGTFARSLEDETFALSHTELCRLGTAVTQSINARTRLRATRGWDAGHVTRLQIENNILTTLRWARPQVKEAEDQAEVQARAQRNAGAGGALAGTSSTWGGKKK